MQSRDQSYRNGYGKDEITDDNSQLRGKLLVGYTQTLGESRKSLYTASWLKWKERNKFKIEIKNLYIQARGIILAYISICLGDNITLCLGDNISLCLGDNISMLGDNISLCLGG